MAKKVITNLKWWFQQFFCCFLLLWRETLSFSIKIRNNKQKFYCVTKHFQLLQCQKDIVSERQIKGWNRMNATAALFNGTTQKQNGKLNSTVMTRIQSFSLQQQHKMHGKHFSLVAVIIFLTFPLYSSSTHIYTPIVYIACRYTEKLHSE